MKTVIASSLEQGEEAFSDFGELLCLPESDIHAAVVRDADAVIVRSKTRLDQNLLEGSSVKFAATATAGVDHVDQPWLKAHGIQFYAAHGCNATSVTEYVIAALLEWSEKTRRNLEGLTLGIVGVGQVGSRLIKKAKALGLNVLLNDPPRVGNEGWKHSQPLGKLLAESDILSFHVPLVYEPPWPTFQMITDKEVHQMKPGVLFINASRGEITTEAALLAGVASGRIGQLVLDVFPEEPAVSDELLQACLFATPHIAGHSFEGKLNGTLMCRQAFMNVFGVSSDWTPIFPDPPRTLSVGSSLLDLYRQVYDIRSDDQRFREGLAKQGVDRIAEFNRQRREYPRRYEASRMTIDGGCAIHDALGFAPSTQPR